jgi:hypothetical protein
VASIVGCVDVRNLPRKAGWEDYGKIEISRSGRIGRSRTRRPVAW